MMYFQIKKIAKQTFATLMMVTIVSYLVQAVPLRDSSGNGCTLNRYNICAVKQLDEQQAPTCQEPQPQPDRNEDAQRRYNVPRSQPQQEQNPTQQSKQDFIKNFNRTFSNVRNKSVYVSNKYGRVDIKTWGQNSVQVNVRLTVRADNQATANVTFERINIDFTEGGDFVKSETVIASRTGGSCDYTVDYEVFMPANNPLVLSNRYGNSYIASLSGNANIEQKYGNFSLDASSSLTVSLGYGTGNIGTCSNLNGTVGYGKLNVGTADNVQLKTKYSHFNIGKIQQADFNSSYDDIKIGTVQSAKLFCRYSDCMITNVDDLNAKGDYTDFVVQNLEHSGVLNTNYGSIRVSQLSRNVNLFDIQCNYTNCVVKFDPTYNGQFDFQANYSGLSRPASLRTSYEQKQGATHSMMGIIGNNPATKNMVRVRLKYGQFTFK